MLDLKCDIFEKERCKASINQFPLPPPNKSEILTITGWHHGAFTDALILMMMIKNKRPSEPSLITFPKRAPGEMTSLVMKAFAE